LTACTWLHYAQICNGSLPAPSTKEELIHDALQARLLPGEGDIDVQALFATLPAQITVSVEIPHSIRVAQIGCKAWVMAALRAAQRTLGVAA
jgi:hypothetical protein